MDLSELLRAELKPLADGIKRVEDGQARQAQDISSLSHIQQRQAQDISSLSHIQQRQAQDISSMNKGVSQLTESDARSADVSLL